VKAVALFGTSHSYQIPGDAGSPLRAPIEKACVSLKIRAIAEEFSVDELINRNVDASICEQIATRFNIRHRYCDPNPEEREKLGVRHESLIKAEGWHRNWAQERIKREVRASHAIREQHWLNQIVDMNCWPTLFVCGAYHVSPFAKLLRQNGITVKTIERDWEPAGMNRQARSR
jgi:hypothetical protein